MSNSQILEDARTKVWGQAALCFGCSVTDNRETNTKTLQRETRDVD